MMTKNPAGSLNRRDKLTGGTLELPRFEINLNYLDWRKIKENRNRRNGNNDNKNGEMDNPGGGAAADHFSIFNQRRPVR